MFVESHLISISSLPMKNAIKILFFSDTHLGFDHALNPRVNRRRRGPDFFDNYLRILNFGLTEKTDLIVHGGDVFFRSRVPPSVLDQAYEPLLKVANAGIPVYLVPGNHERSKLPKHLWLAHNNIRVFDQPRTFLQTVRDTVISLSGFPYTRNPAGRYRSLINQTGYLQNEANLRLLCLHQTFEGARVGPKNYTFRVGPDNIPGYLTPGDFNAVLSGHIHRGQRLTRTLNGESMAVPIIYSGSVERTSFAERFEDKYFVMIRVHNSAQEVSVESEYHQIPARPMAVLEISTLDLNVEDFAANVLQRITQLAKDSIVRISVSGPEASKFRGSLSSAELRKIAPSTMNITMDYPRETNQQNRV